MELDTDSTNMRILFAEDRPTLRKILTYKLEQQGYEVFGAPNGLEAVRLIHKDVFDLILLDVNMPVLNGLDGMLRIQDFFALDTSENDIPPIISTENRRMS